MPTILGANTESGAYEISNSLRLNDGDSPYLNKTPSSAGNRRTFTISLWTKRSDLNTSSVLYGAGTASTDMFQIVMQNDGGDNIIIVQDRVSSTNNLNLNTSASFRDPSAWYHIVLAVDTTQSTSSNRAKLYVNGTQITAFSTETYPSQNYDCHVNNTVAHHIGAQSRGSANNHFDGYITELHSIDGTAQAQTAFGEFNDNGVWIPKKYTGGSYGTNGFFMEFKQTGTGTNASGIGADTSGNDNHFAVNNLAAIDITTDTCTNNFATINPLANYFDPATLSEGNTRVDFANNVSTSYVISTIGVDTGKWYCEVNGVDIPSYGEIGIASRPRQNSGNNDKLTVNVNNYGYTANAGNVKNNSTAGSSYGDSFGDGDVIGIAMDLDNNKLYFSKNGTFQNSGDPTSGSTGTGAFSIAAASDTHDGVYYFAGGSNINNNDTRMDFNFGNPAYSISSGNSDANGHGNFEYSVPSGYFALCTKNLAESG